MEQKKTKIICTISDLNCSVEFIKELYLNGMNVARINSAHATIEGAQMIVDNIRAVSDKIAILIDTKGPEVRLTAMDSAVGFIAKEGDTITIGSNTESLCTARNLWKPKSIWILLSKNQCLATLCQTPIWIQRHGKQTASLPVLPVSVFCFFSIPAIFHEIP